MFKFSLTVRLKQKMVFSALLKGKGNAPPQMLILLWHHFCYYKRHWIKCLFTILLPLLLLGQTTIMAYVFTKYVVKTTKPLSNCEFDTESPVSSGPLASRLSVCLSRGGKCSNDDSDKSFIHNLLDGRKHLPESCNTNSMSDCFFKPTNRLLYYPNNSIAMEIISKMEEIIGEYFQFSNENLPKGVPHNIQANDCSANETHHAQIIGMENRQEAIEFAKELKRKQETDEKENWIPSSDLPVVVGIISFDQTKENKLNYRIIIEEKKETDRMTDTDSVDYSYHIQDLVENAFIRIKVKEPSLRFGTALKQIPRPCWETIGTTIYTVFSISVSFNLMFSFIMSPINFLEQVLTEKSMKLREYLYIMGVGSLQLKLSWILFYTLFLFPLSVVFALFTIFLPGSIMGHTDPSLIFMTVFLFNISQLSFCYMLASFLKTSRRTGILIVFLNMFFYILSSSLFQKTKLYGSMLVLGRICCLYCATPAMIAFAYMFNWETVWIGGQWKNFFFSPYLADQFGGFGECFLWLIGDTVLYLLVAWYLEHVMPGEYGVKHKPYFFIQPSFWFPSHFKSKTNSIEPSSEADIETTDSSALHGVQLQNLTKVYGKANAGICNLSLNFQRNEITAFLGENGAGKSTTMNILVGLISPTSGNALVHELSTANQIEQIRQIIGFVPQYDILYPSMTVEEHFQFYGWLKGFSKNETRQMVDPLLTSFNLINHKSTIIMRLSGGEKRKLSILTAYMGSPDVVILDEPTSGVDPFSRRGIWEMILSHRKMGTTILSTHFMEEADILADRIAIISQGGLVCNGTPMYLKNQYGKGSQIIIACEPQNPKQEEIKYFIMGSIPGSQVAQEQGMDISFLIPGDFAQSISMVEFLKKFEEKLDLFSVVSYGLTEPTMEQVFFASIERKSGCSTEIDKPNDAEEHTMEQLVEECSIDFTASNYIGCKKFLWQVWGLLQKKVLGTVSSWSTLLFHFLLPLAFIFLLLTTGNHIYGTGGTVQKVHIWEKYRTNVLFIRGKGEYVNPFIETAYHDGFSPRCPGGIDGFSCSGHPRGSLGSMTSPMDNDTDNLQMSKQFHMCKCPTTTYCDDQNAERLPMITTRSYDHLYRIGDDIDLNNWLISANSSHQTTIGGFQFLEIHPNQKTGVDQMENVYENYGNLKYVNIWYKPELKLAMVNLWNNLFLQTANETDAEIGLEIEAVDFGGSEISITSTSQMLLGSWFLVFCFAFGTLGMAVFIQHENSTGLKRLQLLFGANPILYWLVSLTCDFLLFVCTISAVIICLAAFNNPFKEHLQDLIAVVVPFGYLSITFIYLLSFLFRKSQGIIVATIVFTILSLIIASSISPIEIMWIRCDTDCSAMAFAAIVSNILRLFPTYFITDALCIETWYYMLIETRFSEPYEQDNKVVADSLYSMNYLGKRILTAFIMGTIYFVLVLILESLDLRIKSKCCHSSQNRFLPTNQVADPDVCQEEERVDQEDAQDPLVLKKLTKVFRGMVYPAVNNVTLGIQHSQCFGLLGINGAGKTTLFRMLTGFLRPTSGQAQLESKNLFGRGWSRLAGASYCPQENTLFANLSVRGHMKLFGKIRGIPKSSLDSVVRSMAEDIDLMPHFSKKASELSGGNQRKLQFVLSLLGHRPVIFLDEPTTGMDPGSRRKAWTMIRQAVDKGCSVVLTSHSMEECEALCHRLVIMVAGSFQCIGSVQYLKDKFGNKYTFKLKINKNASFDGNVGEAVKEFITSKFPAQLIEEHSSQLHFEVSAVELKLSSLFEILLDCKSQLPIEDFSVSQITLEHVFVNMAKTQEVL